MVDLKIYWLLSGVVFIFGIGSFPLKAASSLEEIDCDEIAKKIISDLDAANRVDSNNEIVSCSENGKYSAALGQRALAAGKYAYAETKFLKASELNSVYLINLAGVYYDYYLKTNDLSLLTRAKETVHKFIVLHPDDPEALRLTGMIYFKEGFLEEAEKSFLDSIRIFPSAVTYEHLARVHFRKRCFSCVIGDLEQGSNVDASVLGNESYMYLGVAAFVEMKRYKDAINTLGLLVEHNNGVLETERYKKTVKIISERMSSDGMDFSIFINQ